MQLKIAAATWKFM